MKEIYNYSDYYGNKLSVSLNYADKTTNEDGYQFFNVYVGERVLLLYKCDTPKYTKIKVNDITNSDDYYTDTNGILYLDITDELRVCLLNNEDYYLMGEIYIRPLAGVNPKNLLLPMPTDLMGSDEFSEPQILPPNLIYSQPLLRKRFDLVFEVLGYFIGKQYVLIKSGNVAVGGGTVGRNLILKKDDNVTNQAIEYVISDKGYPVINYCTILDDCENACVLRWLSATGVYRQAIWKIKKVTRTATSTALMPIADNYLQRRGFDISFVAYIEGLNDYDFAYYSDIIISSDVHCAINDDDDIESEYTSVAVDTKNYTQIDGNSGELKTLEITVNYKHYDTL